MHRMYVGDVAGNPMVIGGQAAFLAEEHREVQLRQLFPIAVVAVADILVQQAVGRDARDVVAEEIILEDPVHPGRHESLFFFLSRSSRGSR